MTYTVAGGDQHFKIPVESNLIKIALFYVVTDAFERIGKSIVLDRRFRVADGTS